MSLLASKPKITPNICLILIIMFLGSSIYCNAQWNVQNSNTTVDLFEVCFVDSLHGWVLGANSILLTTKNGGNTWVKQIITNDSNLVTCMDYISPGFGFAVGNNGLFMSTNDSGYTWQTVNNNFDYDFQGISFVNDSVGWITGSKETQSTRESVVLQTKNAGLTWEKQLEIVSTQLFNSVLFNSIEFLNDTVGWVIGSDYVDGFSATIVYSTKNAGEDWNFTGEYIQGPLRKLEIASEDTLWSSGYGQFAISNNAGITWDSSPSIIGLVYSCLPINGQNGIIFQFEHNTNAKQILFTTNGGKDWSLDFEPEMAILDMDNYKNDSFWAVGEKGMVLRRNVSPTSISSPIANQIRAHLEQNHPNPFNPTTIIKYKLSSDGKVLLELYNVLGEKQKTLINKDMNKGEYSIVFNGNNFPSGVYIYSLTTGEYSESKKMILLK